MGLRGIFLRVGEIRYYIKLFHYGHNSDLVRILFMKVLENFLFPTVRNEICRNSTHFLQSTCVDDNIFLSINVILWTKMQKNGPEIKSK